MDPADCATRARGTFEDAGGQVRRSVQDRAEVGVPVLRPLAVHEHRLHARSSAAVPYAARGGPVPRGVDEVVVGVQRTLPRCRAVARWAVDAGHGRHRSRQAHHGRGDRGEHSHHAHHGTHAGGSGLQAGLIPEPGPVPTALPAEGPSRAIGKMRIVPRTIGHVPSQRAAGPSIVLVRHRRRYRAAVQTITRGPR